MNACSKPSCVNSIAAGEMRMFPDALWRPSCKTNISVFLPFCFLLLCMILWASSRNVTERKYSKHSHNGSALYGTPVLPWDLLFPGSFLHLWVHCEAPAFSIKADWLVEHTLNIETCSSLWEGHQQLLWLWMSSPENSVRATGVAHIPLGVLSGAPGPH